MENTELSMFNESIVFVTDKIAVKPFCVFFGLDSQNQMEKIKKDPVLKQLYGIFRVVGSDNKERDMFCLSKRGFVRWIDRISPQNVDENIRPKFIDFQILIDEYLYGDYQQELQAKIDYARLKKLKTLYGKIGREIQRIEKQFNHFIENKFQYQLNFEPKQFPQ